MSPVSDLLLTNRIQLIPRPISQNTRLIRGTLSDSTQAAPRSVARDTLLLVSGSHNSTIIRVFVSAMANTLHCLPAGSRILVTGANGFIGSNVIQCLLELGFRVRGAVRSPKPWLDEMFRGRFGGDSYESVVLANFEDVESLVGVMEGVAGVAHVVCCPRWGDF